MLIQQALKLPKIFIFTAFLNFIIGSTLGGIMAGDENLWPVLSAYHAELNPFGWLTLLIYGMTYVVLFLSLGLKLPRRWQGALHVVAAEGSIVLVILALLLHNALLDRFGLIVQALTPLVFMTNILSMVIARKRKRRSATETPDETNEVRPQRSREPDEDHVVDEKKGVEASGLEMSDLEASWSSEEDIVSLFGVVDELKATDSVAQRGTDVSLMIFIVAGLWMVVTSLMQPIAWPFSSGSAPELLTYYGWIAGTVLAVAMHLYPRLMGVRSIAGWYAQIGQIAWGAGVVLLLAGSVWGSLTTAGSRAVGLGIAWQAAGFLSTMRFDTRVLNNNDRFRLMHALLWTIAWFFAVVLGVLLLLGISPLSLAALHLLFLGWITTLVYSIGYRVFPLLLGKAGPPISVAVFQAAATVTGAILMPFAFIRLMHGGQHAFAELAVGGILAAVGALVFLLQWVFSGPVESVNREE